MHQLFVLLPQPLHKLSKRVLARRLSRMVRPFYCVRRGETANWRWWKMLIAAFILVISTASTIQFAVFSWRASLLRTVSEPLINEAEGTLRPCLNLLSSSSFQEILAVYRDLCPNFGAGSASNLRGVSFYYALMRFLGSLGSSIVPAEGVGWTEREMALCTQYATVRLSQRLERNVALVNEARSFQ
jgi:hypothetical protein